MKKGWRTPFSFKITPRRARRTGPQALFVGSLAQKRSFFTKLKRGTRPLAVSRVSDRQKMQRRKRSVRGKSLKKGWRTPFSFKITPRRPAGLVPRRAERSDRRRPPCAANGAAGPVRRQLGAKAQLFRQAGTPPPRSRSCRGGGVCFCARFSPAARIPARCVQWRPLRPRAAARW